MWERVEPILERRYPVAPTGRPRADLRLVLDGVIYRMRSGVQWNRLPRCFGADSTVHGWFQRFVEDGVLVEIWAALAAECEELGAVLWEWQAADGVMGKSRFDGAKRGPNPTDRAKMGTKKHLLVEQEGGPLGLVVKAANVNDHKLLKETVEAIVIERPDPEKVLQHLCLDKAYDNKTGDGVCEKRGLRPPHPPHRRGEARRPGREDESRPALGGRAHHRLAAEVPRDPRALRQEARELRGPGPTRLRPAVVQTAQAILTALIGFSDSYLDPQRPLKRAFRDPSSERPKPR